MPGVYLSVCQTISNFTQKLLNHLPKKILPEMYLSSRKNQLNFKSYMNPGIFKGFFYIARWGIFQ